MTRKAVNHQPSALSGCEALNAGGRGAFTLIELLVVIGIMALLITALVIAGGGLIDDAKNKETRSVMHLLDMALEEFKQDAPLSGVQGYKDRYGDYPCDELEPFYRSSGIPGLSPLVVVGPPGSVSNINASDDAAFKAIEHRDVAAMALTIRLYSAEAASILDKIGNRFTKAPPNRTDFFDRNGDTKLDIDDEPLVYYVDAWGNPFEYFALCPGNPNIALSDNAVGDRRKTAQQFVQLNHHKPVFASYGPDGTDQLAEYDANLFYSPLVQDFSQADPIGVGRAIDSPLNADNVYLDDELTAKLRIEAPE